MAPKRTILITGGAGFIGSHVVRLFVTKYPDYRIVNLDKLTYAGNLANLRDIEDSPNYVFEKGDICDLDMLRAGRAAAGPSARSSSPKRRSTRRTAPTRLRKPRPTTSCELTTTRTGCRRW